MGGGRHCFSRSVGLFAALGLLVAQSALAFETDLFSVNFPETPQVFHLPIDTVVADSYQAEELDPPVSYVVTVAPFVELVQDVSLRSFLDNEIDAANGTLKTATAFQYEGLEAIAFDARINFEGSWVFRKGVVLRAPDHLIFILAQTPEPVAKQFPKMAASFLESFRLAEMGHVKLPADSPAIEVAENYSSYFGSGWSWVQVKPGQSSLVSNPEYPCQVKAYGWKELATRRRKAPDAPWYSFGDIWANWAWKLVVNASTEAPVYVRAYVSLLSDENFVLSESSQGIDPVVAFQQRDRASELVILRPHEITVLQGANWYNTAEHEGKGSSRTITWRIACYQSTTLVPF